MEAESRKNMGKEEFGDSSGIDVFCAGVINYPLHKAIVTFGPGRDEHRLKSSSEGSDEHAGRVLVQLWMSF